MRTVPQSRAQLSVSITVVLVVALPIAFDPGGFETYLPPKWLLLCTLVPAAAAAAVWAGMWTRGRETRAWLIAWGALVATLALATMVSSEPLVSLIGAPGRNLGLVAWILFGLVAAVGVAVAAGEGTEKVVQALVWGSIPVSVYGLLQALGADPLSYAPGLDVSRARSTFGNAAFLGAYLVLVLPLALDRAIQRDGWRRLVNLLAAALAGGALLATQTRGAWLGAVAALVILVAAWRHELLAHRRETAITGGVAVLALGGLLAVTPLGGRAVSMFRTGRGTAHGRLVQWGDTLDLVGRRPLLGWGPDTYGAVFPRAMSDGFARAAGQQVVPDRAQNGVLDVASAAGVVGLMAWLAVLAVTAMAAWRWRHDRGAVALAAAAAGYLVQLQFGFPLAEVDPLFWLVAGLLVGHHAVAAPVTRGRATRARSAPAPRMGATQVAGAVMLAVAALVGLVWSGREVVADRRLRSAVASEGKQRLPQAFDRYRSAAATARERVLFRQALVRFLRRAGSAGTAEGALPEALVQAERAHRLAPLDPQQELDRADVLLALAEHDHQPAELARAEAAYRAVIVHFRASAQAQQSLGVVLAEEGKLTEAERAWRRAADLAPRAAGPLVDLGLLHARQGRVAEARGELERALRLEPANQAAAGALRQLPAPTSP